MESIQGAECIPKYALSAGVSFLVFLLVRSFVFTGAHPIAVPSNIKLVHIPPLFLLSFIICRP